MLALLVLLIVLEVRHNHNVLVHSPLWKLALVIVDGLAVVGLVTYLRAICGCNVRVGVWIGIQRVYRVNLVCREVLLLGLLLRLNKGALGQLAATV